MTEHSRPRIWLWVGLVVAAVAVWLAIAVANRPGPPGESLPGDTLDPVVADSLGVPEPGREPRAGAVAEEVVARTEEMRAAVRRYEDGCVTGLEAAAGPGFADLTADCIRLLSEAVDAIVASDTVGSVVIDQRQEGFRENVRALRTSPPGDDRAAPTRDALLSAADLLETIRDARYTESMETDGGLGELHEMARSLDPNAALSGQQERVRQFFLRAGAFLSAMARPGDPGPGGG